MPYLGIVYHAIGAIRSTVAPKVEKVAKKVAAPKVEKPAVKKAPAKKAAAKKTEE